MSNVDCDDGANAMARHSLGNIWFERSVSTQPFQFNLWVNGTLTVHNRAANGNRWGSFGMVSAGADYLPGDKALIGLSFHYDHMTDGFTSEQLRASLGAELARQFVFEDGSVLTPKLGVTGGFSGLDGSGAFGSIATGLNWQSPGTLTLDGGLLFNIEGSGQTSIGARMGISGQF